MSEGIAGMRINSEGRKSNVLLETCQVDGYSVELAVTIHQEAPVGMREQWRAAGFVWCERTGLHQFLEQLRACERTRSGSATLRSMTPGALELTIEGRTASGKLGLRYQLQEHLYDSGGASVYSLAISGGFDLDSEFILTLVEEMSDWIASLATEPAS